MPLHKGLENDLFSGGAGSSKAAGGVVMGLGGL